MLKAFVKSRLSRNVRRAARQLADEWQIHRTHLNSVKRARSLSSFPVQLNLGSGFNPKPGWINVDLGHETADFQLDLREPLPFPDESASRIYSEHFFEHLEYASVTDSNAWHLDPSHDPSEALAFLRECRRVLAPGGTCDLVVPDAECIVQEYANRAKEPFPRYEWWGPKWCVTPMHCVNYVFRQGKEHRYAYDFETLRHTLSLAGFSSVRRREFDPSVDAENHRIGSLCVVAVK